MGVRSISQPYDDTMVIKSIVANYKISLVLIDTRSSINFMFYDCFVKLRLHDKDKSSIPFPIMVFIACAIYPKEIIKLSTKVGAQKRKTN